MHILQLEILTPDLAKTEAFYHGVVGFKIINKSNTAISFQAGGSELIFILTETVNPIYHVAFNIPNNKLNEAFAWMAERVEIIDAAPGTKIADFVNWNAKSFYFFDYTGNIMEFIARYELDNGSSAPFTGSSITCISEIGLAANDVAAHCEAMMSKYDIPVFARQPQLPNFAALGDDNGLLIISLLNRNWHLTQYPAQKYHTKVLIRNNNQIQPLSFYVNE